MKIDVEDLGRRLGRLRELRGESLHALAKRADVSKSYIAKLEQGQVGNPGLRTLNSIAAALETTLADLLNRGQKSGSRTPSAANAGLLEYERLLEELPPGLQEFLNTWEAHQKERLPADVVRSLAGIEFRGRRPRTVEDWRFIYDALTRSIE